MNHQGTNMSAGIFTNATTFILTHARLLERVLFQVHFSGTAPAAVADVIRAYQNADGGLGHALEPDLRCPESQPLFVDFGLAAMNEVGAHDHELAVCICDFLETVSDNNGLVPLTLDSARKAPHAAHWSQPTAPGLNPTLGICGCLHRQGIRHPWLARATETCAAMLLDEPPLEAHTLLGATRLIDHLPDRTLAGRLFDIVADALPKATFYIPEAPVETYGLTPLHFAPTPTSSWRELFTDKQINAHLEDLASKQQPDGGWPITWEPPGPAALNEWRGYVTLQAIRPLTAYNGIAP